MRQFYLDILAKDGLGFDTFGEFHRSMALSGAYRKVVTKPIDLEFDILSYAEMDDDEPSEEPIRGLKMQFSLSSSCYATMCIREIAGDFVQEIN